VSVIAVIGFVMHSVAGAVRCVGRLWRNRLAVRPDQIRHPSGPPAEIEASAANALVEGATFLAILLGTIVGGLAAKDGGNQGSLLRPDAGVRADVLGGRAF